MQHNESTNSFHDNQYGGRKGRQPQSAVLNKMLSLDMIRYYAEPAGLIDNDAKACYDRIIPYLTAFMLRRLGMPFFISRFMCNVLRDMEYRIKLNNGMSKQYSNKNIPIFGTGQGAGWSPSCWAANSDVISLSMEKHTPGILIRHPDGIRDCNNHLTAFVDDTSTGVTQDAIKKFKPDHSAPVQPQLSMHTQLEKNMGFYSRTLEATGGALSWEKCRAYLLLFEWSNGKKIQVPTKDSHPSLHISNDDLNTIAQILLANPDEAFKMLGIYVSPDGNTKHQQKSLHKK